MFWKVSGGHSAQRRVPLLPRNLPVAQARHTSVASRSYPRRHTQSSPSTPHGSAGSRLLSSRSSCAGPPAAARWQAPHARWGSTKKCPGAQNTHALSENAVCSMYGGQALQLAAERFSWPGKHLQSVKLSMTSSPGPTASESWPLKSGHARQCE